MQLGRTAGARPGGGPLTCSSIRRRTNSETVTTRASRRSRFASLGRGLEASHPLRVVVQEQADGRSPEAAGEVERDLGAVMHLDQRGVEPAQADARPRPRSGGWGWPEARGRASPPGMARH